MPTRTPVADFKVAAGQSSSECRAVVVVARNAKQRPVEVLAHGVQEQAVRVRRCILRDVAGREQRVGATFPASGPQYRRQARLRIDPEQGCPQGPETGGNR